MNGAPQPDRADPAKPVRGREYWIRSVIQLAVLLLLYVLSIGPMFWRWHEAYYIGGSLFIVKLYYPLLLACEIEPIGRVVNWYIELWIL